MYGMNNIKFIIETVCGVIAMEMPLVIVVSSDAIITLTKFLAAF
jgi:hypothetical protein